MQLERLVLAVLENPTDQVSFSILKDYLMEYHGDVKEVSAFLEDTLTGLVETIFHKLLMKIGRKDTREKVSKQYRNIINNRKHQRFGLKHQKPVEPLHVILTKLLSE